MKSKKKIDAKARKATVVAGLLLALAAVAVVPAAAQSQNSTVAENGSVTDENASADVKFSFGQQISIIVSAKQAQVQASVENEAFEIAFGNDEGNRSQAVERRVEELRQRIEEMQQKKKELRQAYKNGNLSRTEFQARMASLSTKVDETKQSVSKVLNKTNATGLDRAALNGVNVTAIRMLKQKASNLTGPQVAAIARSIAGPPAGVRAGPPKGVPGKVGGGNRSQGQERGPPENVPPSGNKSGGSEKTDRRTNGSDPGGEDSPKKGNGGGPPGSMSPQSGGY